MELEDFYEATDASTQTDFNNIFSKKNGCQLRTTLQKWHDESVLSLQLTESEDEEDNKFLTELKRNQKTYFAEFDDDIKLNLQLTESESSDSSSDVNDGAFYANSKKGNKKANENILREEQNNENFEKKNFVLMVLILIFSFFLYFLFRV